MVEALLALLSLVQAAALVLSFRTHAKLAELGMSLAAAQQRAADEAEALDDLTRSARVATEVVDVGVAGAKGVHQAIASIPFGILENIPATRAGAKAVRGVHDAIAGGIYGALSAVNKEVSNRLQRPGQAANPPAPARPVPPPVPTQELLPPLPLKGPDGDKP